MKIIKSFVRNVFNRLGIVIMYKRPWMNNYQWLQNHDIDLVIDVGANVGQYVYFVREVLSLDSEIYSFEPISELYQELKTNCKKYEKINTYNYGLGDRDERIEINVNNFSPSSSILDLEQVHISNVLHTDISTINRKESIKIKRLDDVFKSIDLSKNVLIKLDVQGYEDKVINGGQLTFSKCKVAIIEVSYVPLYKDEKTFKHIYEQMHLLGFEYMGNVNEFKSSEDGSPLYCDAIFVNRNK